MSTLFNSMSRLNESSSLLYKMQKNTLVRKTNVLNIIQFTDNGMTEYINQSDSFRVSELPIAVVSNFCSASSLFALKRCLWAKELGRPEHEDSSQSKIVPICS